MYKYGFTRKLLDSNISDLFSDTYTSFQYEFTQTQCVGVAKEVSNIKVPQLKSGAKILEFDSFSLEILIKSYEIETLVLIHFYKLVQNN